MSLFLVLQLMSCGTPGPTVTSIDPVELKPGTPFKILGERFDSDVKVELIANSSVHPVTDADRQGSVLVTGTVPTDLPAGTWTVVVTTDAGQARLEDSLRVVIPDVELPCGGRFTSQNQYSKTAEEVTIARFWPNDKQQILRVDVADIDGIEYELIRLDDGDLCSVIYLRTATQRLIFDDDREIDLKSRAYQIGQVMGKPVDVTRQDADKLIPKNMDHPTTP